MHPFHHPSRSIHITTLKETIMAAIEDAVAGALAVDGEVEAYIDSLQTENAALTAQVAALTATAAAQDSIAAELAAANAALKAKLPALSTAAESITATVGAAIVPLVLSATGGTAPYSFTVSGLPSSLTAASGQISGSVDVAGTTVASIAVTDAAGATATSTVTVTAA